MKTLKILSLLLSYPRMDLLEALPEMKKILEQEDWIAKESYLSVCEFIKHMQTQDLMDLQEDYVALFDRTPSLSLHLFEHIHGDSRDRGQALVDLGMLYTEAGLQICTDETPDYLPAFLEYLSCLPVDKAQENVAEIINVTAAIGARLEQRESPYAFLFKALESAAQCKPDPKAIEKALAEASGLAQTPEEIDNIWEEQFALETPPSGGGGDCPKAHDILARMEDDELIKEETAP